MKKLAGQIVRYRTQVMLITVLLAAAFGFLSLRVPINTDMTKYLPSDSAMKQGLDIMGEAFSGLALPPSLRVMFEALDEDREEEVLLRLRSAEHVTSAVLSGHAVKDGRSYTLFTLTLDVDYRSPEELALEHGLPGLFPDSVVTVRNDDANGMEIPFFIFVVALVILLGVLFALSGSFLEPFLFLFTIGAAILLNMGSNLILGSVSQTTYSISAILQLVLSMDYSVILMNRYRQERDKALPGGKNFAMERAICSAFPSIASSGFTTLVGLIMLVFMRFLIGRDIGLVLAKGVFLSMVCCLTLLPALILLFDAWIERTKKPALHVPTKLLSRFSYRFRYALMAGFVLLFFGAWYLDSLSGISYSLSREDPIAAIFPPGNPIVVLYDKADEAAVGALALKLEGREEIRSVNAYATTIGRSLSPEEMADYLRKMMEDGGGSYAGMLPDAALPDPEALGSVKDSLNPGTLQAMYRLYAVLEGGAQDGRMSIDQLFGFLNSQLSNPLIRTLIGEEGAERIGEFSSLMDFARSQLTGPAYSIMMLDTALPVEGEETDGFLEALEGELRESCTGSFYLIGNSVMNREMQERFDSELLTISLLTALAIFVVVLVTFRNAAIPAILVLLVQCGVFLAVSTTWLLGYKMYYLALLIVQCILMGATVDYGILFTNYYREHRAHLEIREAVAASYEGAMHTILTSSLFMIFGTGAIGFSPADPTITQICQSISIGASAATLLVIFVLPGLLAALDRFVVPKGRRRR